MGQSFIDRNRLWARLNGAVAAHGTPLPTPTMVVDLDAFDANADDLVRRAGGKPVRVASKSLRIPALVQLFRELHSARRTAEAVPATMEAGRG